MRSGIILFFLFSSSILFSINWSENNTIKFNSDRLTNYNDLLDYSNIEITNGYITSASDSNCWLISSDISVDDDFVFSSAFVNFTVADDNGISSNSSVTLKVFDYEDAENMHQEVFYKSGSFELNNIFLRNVTIYLEIHGADTHVYSFGVTKKQLSLINTNDLHIIPSILFSGENTLNISFSINYPAYTDILIFNKYGKIVEPVCKKKFFNEGTNSVIWDPETSPVRDLVSGGYFIYFKAVTLNGKSTEAVKNLIFVKN